MDKKLRIIKAAYLIGAIIDGFWAVALAFPSFYKTITNGNDIEINPQTRVVFIIAASLMLGWTLLLLWGYQKPIERRAVLLMTAFPVVSGISIGTIFGIVNGNYSSIFFLIKTLAIIILMLYAYSIANKASQQLPEHHIEK